MSQNQLKVDTLKYRALWDSIDKKTKDEMPNMLGGLEKAAPSDKRAKGKIICKSKPHFQNHLLDLFKM
jgi:hypothetical protein